MTDSGAQAFKQPGAETAQPGLAERNSLYCEVFERFPEAVFIFLVSPEGKMSLAALNPAAERLLGKDAASAAGQEPGKAFRDSRLSFLTASLEKCLEAGKPGTTSETVGVSGSDLCYQVEVSASGNQPGQIERLICFVREVREAVQAVIPPQKDAQEGASLRRQIEQLTALREVSRAISANLDLETTLRATLTQAVRKLRADAADVLLFNPQQRVFEYAAGMGFSTRAIEDTCLRVDEAFAARAAQERKTIFVRDLSDPANKIPRAELLKSEGFRSFFAIPLVVKNQIRGLLEIFYQSPADPDEEWLSFIEQFGGQAAVIIDHARLLNDLQRLNVDLAQAAAETVEGWARALDLRNHETDGHTQRVTDLVEKFARAMGVSESEILNIRRGAILHDIGKLGVSEAILQKPGPFSEDDWQEVRKHPVVAYDLLKPIAFLQPAVDIPYGHHEKWDGTGYPRGLKGEEIPLSARMFAIVDVWDALASERVFRKAWPKDEILKYIQSMAETHFDPLLVKMFLKLI